MHPAHSHHPDPPDWAQALRNKGLRVTAQRIAVLEALHRSPHASADAVFQTILAALPTTSVQAVHLIVADLARGGLIQRVSTPDSQSARYETRVGDNHHHVQCVVCGRIEDVDCVIGHAPCIEPSHTHGMRILEANIVFRGVCQACDSPSNEEAHHE